MVSLVPDVIRRLLSQYTLERENKQLNEDLMCTLCKKLMIDAYQTSCGCQYCRGCIHDYLSNKEHKYCIGTKDDCKEDSLVLDKNVLRNAMFNRRILRVKVTCPNATCPFSTELQHMEDHLQACIKHHVVCPYSTIGCANECEADDTLTIHLHNETVPHTHLLIEWINNLRNEMDGLKLELAAVKEHCVHKENTMVHDHTREMERIKDNFKKNENKISDLEKESTKKEKIIQTLVKKTTDTENMIVKLQTEAKWKDQRIMELENNDKISHLEARLVVLESESKKIEESEDVIASVDTLRTTVYDLQTTVDSINVGTNTNVAVGVITIKVDNFSIFKIPDEGILSPYFYSHTNGYKLKLRIYPGGTLDGKGTYLSVFIAVCSGEYDDILPWPCMVTIKVGIVNQNTAVMTVNASLGYDSATDDTMDSYLKPKDGDNTAIGRSKFISHNDLNDIAGLCIDDSVIIKCVVNI